MFYLICEMLFNVNYFTAHKGKTLLCRVYKSRDDPFTRVCRIPYNLFPNDFLYSPIIIFFLLKSSSIRRKSDAIQ